MLSCTRLNSAIRVVHSPSHVRCPLRTVRSASTATPRSVTYSPLDPSLLHGSPDDPIDLNEQDLNKTVGVDGVQRYARRHSRSDSLFSSHHRERNDKIWLDFSKRLDSFAPLKSTDSAALLEQLRRQTRYASIAQLQLFLPKELTSKYERYAKLIKDFNWHLRLMKKQPYSDWSAKKLWSHYQQFKRAMPSEVSQIPDGAWRILWRSQSQFRPADPDRMKNLKTLVEDGKSHGKSLRSEEQVLAIEEQAHIGKVAEAVEQWRVEFLHNHTKSGKRKEWLELGVRLLALSGDLERACKLIMWGLRHHKSLDPRCMTFIIHIFASTGDAGHLRHAWAIYKDIQTHESFVLCTDDYRTLISTFLEGSHVHFALKVARDLALDPRLTDKKSRIHELQAGLSEVLKRCTSQKQLMTVCLTAMSFLPSSIAWDRFFFDWMSCASQFRSKPFDTCAQIVELMFERGHKPQARHLEQMAMQWLRADKSRREKALEVCWDMINKRLAEPAPSDPLFSALEYDNNKAADEDSPAFASRILPTATPRTFTMLARHYAQNGQPNDALRALELLSEADITLNERTVRDILLTQFYLNQPVMTLCVFDEIRKAVPQSINLHAYSILWRTLNKHVTVVNKVFRTHIPTQEDFMRRLCMIDENGIRMPTPRELFRDMMCFIRSSKRRHSIKDSPRFLVFHTVLTFMKAKDPLAALVAMRALKAELGLMPNLLTLDSIIHYTALRAATVENFEVIRAGKHVDLESYKNLGYTVLEHIFMSSTTEEDSNRRQPNYLYDDDYLSRNGQIIFEALEAYLVTLFQSHWGSIEAVHEQICMCEQEMGLRLSDEEEEEHQLLASLSKDVSVIPQPLTDSDRNAMTIEEQRTEETIRSYTARSAEEEVRARWKDVEPILKDWDEGLSTMFGSGQFQETIARESPFEVPMTMDFDSVSAEEQEDNVIDFDFDFESFKGC